METSVEHTETAVETEAAVVSASAESTETKKSRVRTDSHPWTLTLLALLADGEWHPYRAIVNEAARIVPPGTAWRKAEYYREKYYKNRGVPVAERKHGDRNDTIKTGQRMIVGHAITALRRNKRVEVEYEPRIKRRKPIRIRRIDL